jgi:hypothetical protein
MMGLIRNVEKRGREYMEKFSREMWKQLGMRVFVLAAHVDRNDTVCISK